MSYKIRAKFQDPEYGNFTKEQILSEGYSVACDGFMYVSILWPENGDVGMSVKFAGMDGRTREPLDDHERFKVWAFLANELSESSELGEGRKKFCEAVDEVMREALGKNSRARMMTPEREKEIREVNEREGPSVICSELLAEVDRLRIRIAKLRKALLTTSRYEVAILDADDKLEGK